MMTTKASRSQVESRQWNIEQAPELELTLLPISEVGPCKKQNALSIVHEGKQQSLPASLIGFNVCHTS
jgi:hypothetical protein